MSIDLQGKRLFIAELGNNSIDIIDLKLGKRIGSISNGLDEPQGVMYIPETNRIAVANGGDGSVKFYDNNSSFSLVGDVKLADDADNIRYDNSTGLLYVGYGDGAVAIINATTGKTVGDIKLNAHPESFQLEQSGTRIFVNVPPDHSIEVADKQKTQQPTSRWAADVTGATENYPMALDEANHRLFVGFRDPAKVIVYDTQTGKEVASMDTTKDADDIFYDSHNKQIYVSGGEGFIDVYKQIDADHYELVIKIATAQGARTSLFVPELDSLYLAVPASGNQQNAQLRIYEVQ
jgi:DNA-binding beta-propeller fold protein YncE